MQFSIDNPIFLPVKVEIEIRRSGPVFYPHYFYRLVVVGLLIAILNQSEIYMRLHNKNGPKYRPFRRVKVMKNVIDPGKVFTRIGFKVDEAGLRIYQVRFERSVAYA